MTDRLPQQSDGNKLHAIFASLHYHNYHDAYDELAWTKWLEDAKADTAALIATAKQEARAEERHRAYNKIVSKGPHKIPKPIKDSPMELTRDAEVWNDVVEQFYQAINTALTPSEPRQP